MRIITVITQFEFQILIKDIGIIEFSLPRIDIDRHRLFAIRGIMANTLLSLEVGPGFIFEIRIPTWSAPMVVTYIGIDGMGIGELMGIAQLSVSATVVATIARDLLIGDPLSRHIALIVGQGLAPTMAEHTEAIDIEIIMIREVISSTQTDEDIIAMMARRGIRIGERAIIKKTSHLAATIIIMAHTEADAGVSIPLRRVIIDIDRGIAAAIAIGREFGATEITTSAILLKDDIDDTGRSLGAILCRGIGDYLDTFDAFAGDLFEDLSTIVGGKARLLAIDPDGHRLISTKRDITILIDLNRRDRLEEFGSGLTGRSDISIDLEHLTIQFEAHLAAHALHHDLLKHFGIISQADSAQIEVLAGYHHRTLLIDAAHIRDLHYITAIRQRWDRKITIIVGIDT